MLRGLFGRPLSMPTGIPTALLPRLIGSHVAGEALPCDCDDGGGEWSTWVAANLCERLIRRVVRRDRRRSGQITGSKTARRNAVDSLLQRIYGAASWQARLRESWHVRRFLSYRFTTCRDRVHATVQRCTDDSLTGSSSAGETAYRQDRRGFSPQPPGAAPSEP